MSNPNLTEDEMNILRSTKSEDEWNNACDQVKKARGGRYPDDWYVKVILSGFLYNLSSTWK